MKHDIRAKARDSALSDQEIASLQRPDQWAELNEEMQLVMSALGQLPVEQPETINFEAGMGFRQIARVQGVSVNTAHGRYR